MMIIINIHCGLSATSPIYVLVWQQTSDQPISTLHVNVTVPCMAKNSYIYIETNILTGKGYDLINERERYIGQWEAHAFPGRFADRLPGEHSCHKTMISMYFYLIFIPKHNFPYPRSRFSLQKILQTYHASSHFRHTHIVR